MPENPSYVHTLAGILAEARTPKPSPSSAAGTWRPSPASRSGRQAVNLMHRIGAVRVSRELAIEQRELVRWLERMIVDPTVAQERHRHETVIGRIVELKAETAARAVKIVLPAGATSVDLPDGVSLGPAWLTVSFENEQQLLERLFLLARVLAAQPQILSSLSLTR